MNVRWHPRVLRRPQVQVVRQGTQSNQGDSSSEGDVEIINTKLG